MRTATLERESAEHLRFVGEAVAGFQGFIRWAAAYGYELRHNRRTLGGIADGHSDFLDLSAAMSASFNFGYDSSDQAVFFAVEQEEFEWLPFLPIEEVVVSSRDGARGEIYILTSRVDLGEGDELPPLAIQVQTDQPKLWAAFPTAKDIGFMCVRFDGEGVLVEEFSPKRYPLRFVTQ